MIDYQEICHEIRACRNCSMSSGCRQPIPGEGSLQASVFFVGEAPGQDEDKQNALFVGRSGQLLRTYINKFSFQENDFYLTNIIKCHPKGNRTPAEAEMKICMPHFRQEVRLIMPKIIVCLGACASRILIDPGIKVTQMHGKWIKKGDFWLLPTLHPAALLRDVNKQSCWDDDFARIKEKLIEIKGENNGI